MALFAAGLIWLILATLALQVGSTGNIGWPEPAARAYRIERVAIASLVGAGLASAGVACQAVLRNPLADPYLLGISSGASLFAYLWQLPFMTTLLAASTGFAAVGEHAFAFIGAVATALVVFLLATRRGRLEPLTLLLVGVIVNALNSSIFLLLNTLFREPASTAGPLSFLVGAIQASTTRGQEIIAAVCIGVGWATLLLFAGQLNATALSDSEAQSLGVRIHRLRWIALLAATLITASAVALSGPIGFVGLICPHLARLVVGHNQRRLLPFATAFGAGLLCLADAAARGLSQSRLESVLPVGVLTGLLGGPFFLMLLWQRRRRTTLDHL